MKIATITSMIYDDVDTCKIEFIMNGRLYSTPLVNDLQGAYTTGDHIIVEDTADGTSIKPMRRYYDIKK